jgi:hypothetical protein
MTKRCHSSGRSTAEAEGTQEKKQTENKTQSRKQAALLTVKAEHLSSSGYPAKITKYPAGVTEAIIQKTRRRNQAFCQAFFVRKKEAGCQTLVIPAGNEV